MKFSYTWLKELISFKESPQKLAELLMTHAFEVESVERVGTDWALDINIPANRTMDAANHRGLAREIGAILKRNPKFKTLNSKQIQNPKSKIQNNIKIKIEKPELCSRYTAQILQIQNLGASPKWMQERLTTYGFRPLNAVVDVTNYVMLETGQPLHAFDYDKIQGGKMTIRESRAGETLTTLDGTKHELPQKTIVIEDGERIIDLAGIMGGENSAVMDNTKTILLQAAVFDATHIYKTSHTLRFSSAASKLYGGGVDTAHSLDALAYAMSLLEQIAGTTPQGPPIDIYPKKKIPRKVLFRPAYANSLIGHIVPDPHYTESFKHLGFTTIKKKNSWTVTIPTERNDIEREEDLIEEATRLFGYENIPTRMPETALHTAQPNDELAIENSIRGMLTGAGFVESFPYEFAGEKELAAFLMDAHHAPELENPTSPETKFLVPRVLIKYARSAAENIRNFDSVKLFGIAKSFSSNHEYTNPKQIYEYTNRLISERKDLIITLAEKTAKGEREFYQLKGAVDQLLESLGISDQWYDEHHNTRHTYHDARIFHPYRVAEIKIGDTKIGYLGEIHPEVLKNIKSPYQSKHGTGQARARIVAAEINFDTLWRLVRDENEYQPIGKYPAIVRDIAIVVPWETKTVEVMNVLNHAGGELLKDVDLFDYFQDEELRGEEKKSLAFHLIFQSPERTLKDEEIDQTMSLIITTLKDKKWLVR